MTTWLLLIALGVVLFVYARHQGDWTSAQDEVRDVLHNLWQAVSPYVPQVTSWVVKYKWRIIAVVVLAIFLMVNYGLPQMGPPKVELHGGENQVSDLCGNVVTVWVLPAHVDPNNRLEVTPAEMGQTIEIKKPGADSRCAFNLALSPKK